MIIIITPLLACSQCNGDLLWYKHVDWQGGNSQWARGGNGQRIGQGWQNFRFVFAASEGVIYAVEPNGDLLWYKHEDWQNGNSQWARVGNGQKVGQGWQNFLFVCASGNGVIYAVQPNGDLLWYKHEGWQNGSSRWAKGGIGQKIGRGWQNFRSAFSTSDGVIYAIRPNGDLLWYKHLDWQHGINRWEPASGGKVGQGWQNFRSVFASSEGTIYAVQRDGDLLWYKHREWLRGKNRWVARSGRKVGRGWQNFRLIFATGEGSMYGIQSNIEVSGDLASFHPSVQNGGRAISIAVHPTDANQIIVASESGGLFRTADGGRSWRHISGMPNHYIWDVEYSPSNPNIVIVAAGSNFRIPNDGGIWRSTDGGITWNRPIGASPTPGSRCTDRSNAYDVSFSPSSPDVFVGTDCGIAISHDDGATWSHQQLDPSAPSNSSLTQNAVYSVLATGNRLFVAAADGLWRSTLPDNAFERIQNGPVRGQAGINHAFAVSPLNPDHIFHAGNSQQLFLSTNSGLNWTQVQAPTNWNRGAFVRATRSGSNSNQIDVYFGDGLDLQRQTFTQIRTGLTSSGLWAKLSVDHPDPADIAFDHLGIPVLLATDGGVHSTSNGGTTWHLTGGGACGFNALQINVVTGQIITVTQPHQDLYYGTQDNYAWASPNDGMTWTQHPTCGDGWYLQIIPSVADHSNTEVTGTCNQGNYIGNQHFSNLRPFQNPPDGDNILNDVDGSPFLISAGTYIQNTIDNNAMIPINTFRLTQNTGGNWQVAFAVRPTITGRPQIAGTSNNPTLYQVVIRPGNTINGLRRFGLVRVTNFLSGAGVVSDVDGSGFGSIGIWPGMFDFHCIFAVNPANPLHLIYADIETSEMKYTVDGGQNWYVDRTLTDLVTENGSFLFNVGEKPHVRAISFDPFNPCLILVGTDQNGIIRSNDGGNTWSKINGSEAATFISSFYFPPTGPITISTYGRGLWQMTERNAESSCVPPISRSIVQKPPARIIDIKTGVFTPFQNKDAPPLPLCPNCKYIFVHNGMITNLELDSNKLAVFSISGGSVYQLDENKQEVPLSIPNKYLVGHINLDQFPKVRSQLMSKGTKVRGIILENDIIKSMIISDTELLFEPSRVPYIRLTSANMTGGVVKTESGGKIIVHGEGFGSSRDSIGLVEIRLDDETVAKDILVDFKGNFRKEITIHRMPGTYEIIVEQREGLRLVQEKSIVQVMVEDTAR